MQNLDKSQPLPSTTTSVSTTPKKTPRTNTADDREEDKEDGMLDIRTLREKSRNLDLPLISALCNDRYLLKQTKAFVLPKNPNDCTSPTTSKSTTRSCNRGGDTRNKYPASEVSNTQISKPPRKSSTLTHKHPAENKSTTFKGSISLTASPLKKDATRSSHS